MLLPILVFIVGIVVVVSQAYTRNQSGQKREEAMSLVAHQLKMKFYADGDPSFDSLIRETNLVTRGTRQKAINLLMGSYRGNNAAVFDFHYVTGDRKTQHRWHTTVACLWFDGDPLPTFAVRPEHLWHRLGKLFGFRDLNFDSRPEFSRMFVLQGEAEEQIRAEFNANALRFFEGRGDISCEACGNVFLLYRSSRSVPPDKIRSLLDEAIYALQLFRPIPEEPQKPVVNAQELSVAVGGESEAAAGSMARLGDSTDK